ncbi:hypothetical protein V2S66_31515 [Streptomyces sp. V4-01]|uniref:Uncharacterized protein n=1 Tax=Actinacidiphila polyblastidii TaxID=3110430 RepID=A0ABU7PKX1_9ACTN|nr:hypothetical protein [Streptomyces sp. V4-01]
MTARWPDEPADVDEGLFDPDDIALLLGLPDPIEPPRRPVHTLRDISTYQERQ